MEDFYKNRIRLEGEVLQRKEGCGKKVLHRDILEGGLMQRETC